MIRPKGTDFTYSNSYNLQLTLSSDIRRTRNDVKCLLKILEIFYVLVCFTHLFLDIIMYTTRDDNIHYIFCE